MTSGKNKKINIWILNLVVILVLLTLGICKPPPQPTLLESKPFEECDDKFINEQKSATGNVTINKRGLKPLTEAEWAAVPKDLPESASGGWLLGGLPNKVDRSEFMPPVGDQGAIGSCTAWAVGYAFRSAIEYPYALWDLSVPEHQCIL